MRTIMAEAGCPECSTEAALDIIKAVRSGHEACVEAAIAAGVDVNSRGRNGMSLKPGETWSLEMPVKMPEKPIRKLYGYIESFNTTTPLLEIRYHDEELCKRLMDRLLEAGAEVNQKDIWRKTALLHAANNGHLQCVKTLVNAGAEVSTKDFHGYSAFHYSAMNDDVDCVTYLLDVTSDVNDTIKNGCTALTLAARSTPEIVKVLLKAGADVNHVNKDGRNVLMEATRHGAVECMKILIEAGADVNHADGEGFSTLMEATQRGEEEPVDVLLEAGADVNMCDSVNNTALFTIAYDYEQCVNKLVQKGASVNSVNNSGKSALIVAVERGNIRCVKMLVELGADVNIVDSQGKSALDYCDRYWYGANEKCAKFLLKLGAFVNRTVGMELCDFHEKEKVGAILKASGQKFPVNEESLVEINDVLGIEKGEIKLKHLCREAIRNHLVNLDPHENLFLRIPRLGLPSSMTSYLLFYMTLDD